LQKNEKIYQMLKNAEPTYTVREWDDHNGKVDKLRAVIDAHGRRRHQEEYSKQIFRQKFASMMSLALPIKPSVSLLNSERRT
jgi:hypothetical protein